MTSLCLLLLLIICYFLTWKLSGASSAVSVFSLINFFQAATLSAVSYAGIVKEDIRIGTTYFSAMPMLGMNRVETKVIALFLVMSVGALFAAVLGRIIGGKAKRESYAFIIQSSLEARGRGGFLTSPIMALCLLPLYVISYFHFVSMDQTLLWQNSDYLTIKTPDEIGLTNPILVVYHTLLRVIGLLCIVLFEISLKSRNRAVAIVAFPVIIYSLFLMTAGNSRWIPLYFFAWMATRIILSGKVGLVSLMLLILGLFSFVVVLNGRSSDLFGVSQIYSNLFSVNIDEVGSYFVGVWVNVFEGGMNIANTVLLGPNLSGRYQWGSLSILPSSLDGFDQFRDLDKAKFAIHVPMGGISEAISFSLGAQVVFWSTIFISLVLLDLINRKNRSLITLAINIFSCYVFYILSTYSLRTSFRFIVCIIVVSSVLVAVQSRPTVRRT